MVILRSRLVAVSVPGRTVVVAALLSAVAAIVINRYLFPYLSINNDEALYRLQAQTLAGGHLFPPAPRSAASYAPWLAAVVDGHYVLKYTPVVAGLYALSLVLTGGTAVGLGLLAAAAVGVTYHAGIELLDDRRVAAVAAWLLALSPLIILHSALLLSYLPVLVLYECVLVGLLRGLRTRRGAPLAAAGLAMGLAAAVRPYDTVLMLGPCVLWAVSRGARGRRRWLLRWLGAGLVVPIAALLGYNSMATGNPFRLPFALLEPDDKLGFGDRRLFPGDPPHRFGLAEGLTSIGDHLWFLGLWAFGGVFLAALSVAAVIRRRLSAATLALGAGAVLLILGYIVFWGAWNAAELWGGIRYIGPFYLMPILIPLVLFGARGLVDLTVARPRIGGLTAAACFGLSVVVIVFAVEDNVSFTRRDRNLANMVAVQPGRVLVMVSADPAFLMHPTSVVANPPGMDTRILYAVSRGRADFTVLADHPDRSAYLLRLAEGYNRTLASSSAARLERLRVVDGPSVGVVVRASVPPGARSARLEMTADGRRVSYPVDPSHSVTGKITVSPDGVTMAGLGSAPTVIAAPTAQVSAATDHSVILALFYTPSAGGGERFFDRQDLPVRVDGGAGVSVVAPDGQVGAVGSGLAPAIRLSVG